MAVSSGLLKIMEKVEKLYAVLGDIRPANKLCVDPFEYNSSYLERILKFLDEIGTEAAVERAKVEEEVSKMLDTISIYSKDLEIAEPIIPKCQALPLYYLYVKNELSRVLTKREQLCAEIKALVRHINQLVASSSTLQGAESAKENTPNTEESDKNPKAYTYYPTLENLRELKAKKEKLEKEMKRREALRDNHIERIVALCDIFDRKSSIQGDDEIENLEKTVELLEKELEARIEEHKDVTNSIRAYESDLGVEPYVISNKIDDVTILAMKEYLDALKAEHTRKFTEIFTKTKAELVEISSIFGFDVPDYPETEDGLNAIRKAIELLLPKKGLYCEILATIEKRRQLLEKMTEFEKIASDPGRLFRSSFQLNSEEKFRNTAYPTLLRLEESLLRLLEEYEEKFERFIFDGNPLKEALKIEIDSRIINRTVFISRCDSPYRKKTR